MDYLERNHKALLVFMEKFGMTRFENFAFPMKSHHEFDVIALEKGKPQRVRIICTSSKNKAGAYVANLLKSGAHEKSKSKTKKFNPKDCDLVYVWTPDDTYLIPSLDINVKRAITLSMFSKYKLA